MKALGMTLALGVIAGAASAQVSGPPTSPGTPSHYPYPGQYPADPRYPGAPPWINAQPPEASAQPSATDKSLEAKASEDVTGDVVSTDVKAGTITVRPSGHDADMATDTGNATSELTLPVDSSAKSSLKKVNAGDEVRLICRTDSAGNQSVHKIERIGTQPMTVQPTRQ